MTLFEALTGRAFDRLNWQHSREFDQNFSKKSNAPGFARGGGWAVLELTGTLISTTKQNINSNIKKHDFDTERLIMQRLPDQPENEKLSIIITYILKSNKQL